MTVTNWSISDDSLLVAAHIAVPIHGLFCVLSQVLNGILILVTMRSPCLRTNCNILIGAQAVCDMVFCWYFPYFAYNTFNNRFVTNSECSVAQAVPVAGMNMTFLMILFIGLDRYLCVVHALWYKSLQRRRYFGIYAIIGAVYCGSIATLQYLTRSDEKVLCFIPEAFVESTKTGWIAIECCITFVVIAVYTKLFMFLRKRPREVDMETRKIVKALFVIVMVYVLGYGITIYLWVVSRILFTDVNLAQVVEFSIGIFAGINLDVPFVVYYTQSIVYKREIRRFFRFSTQVAHMQTALTETSM
ncbi:hypothetical protein QR680_014733 [Steinernema hermaphroditum]|uniref:G-protein coupled receptors family 1 profile domain-containing protein n=1 Tax=Steinernema hermaphroditum TaxID=289476 RepID=A0AA39I9X1_9BILA|nr:hypothetical protein QR680_014733 [Steinernema hermaphroditum]